LLLLCLQAKDALLKERDEWRLKVEGIPMAKERKEELLVNNRNLRAERDDLREKYSIALKKLKEKDREVCGHPGHHLADGNSRFRNRARFFACA